MWTVKDASSKLLNLNKNNALTTYHGNLSPTHDNTSFFLDMVQ